MPDPLESARAYVDDLRRRGYPDSEIARMLRQAGWAEEYVSTLLPLPAPPRPAGMTSPASPPEGGSSLATAALVLGLVSIFIFPLALVTGPVAVILGAISLSKRRPGSGLALTGIILAVVSWLLLLVVGPILAAILFPVFSRAQGKAQQSACLSNLKQISLALSIYQVDYDGPLPPAERWPEATFPYIKNAQVYVCPADKRPVRQTQGGHETGYTISASLGGAKTETLPSPFDVGVLFDGMAIAGDREAAAFRHQEGLNLAYADGHVRWLHQGSFGQVSLSATEAAGPPPPIP